MHQIVEGARTRTMQSKRILKLITASSQQSQILPEAREKFWTDSVPAEERKAIMVMISNTGLNSNLNATNMVSFFV